MQRQSDHSTGAFDPKGPGYPNEEVLYQQTYRTSNLSQTAWWSPRTVVILNIVVHQNRNKKHHGYFGFLWTSHLFSSLLWLLCHKNRMLGARLHFEVIAIGNRRDWTWHARLAEKSPPDYLIGTKMKHIFSWDWFKGKIQLFDGNNHGFPADCPYQSHDIWGVQAVASFQWKRRSFFRSLWSFQQ